MSNDNEIEQQDDTGSTPQPEPQEDSAHNPANAEAAKYRHRLREAEAKTATAELAMQALSSKVEVAQRQLVEQRLTGRLRDPADFWRENTLDNLMGDESGDLDYAKVDAAVEATIARHGHWAVSPPRPAAAPADNVRGSAAPGIPSRSVLNPDQSAPAPSWGDVLRAGSRGE